MRASTTVAATLLLITGAVMAAGNHGHDHEHRQPYAGMDQRQISGLSADEIDDLRQGRGMRLALPAELNGYPGPMHTLELRGPLGLSDAQHARTEQLFRQMLDEAKALGEQVIEAERRLHRQFADGAATAGSMREAALRSAELRGELRAVHLRYHLLMMDVLSDEQVQRYAELRGYAGDRHQGKH